MTSHPRTVTLARRGMTLVEMLVATTCTLILMGAIAQVFGAFGTAVSDSRSMIELDGRIRSAAWRLRGDLAGATARTLPPLEVEAGEGYLEIVEGPLSDSASVTSGSDVAPADIDDVLLFTTRNTETPFIGRFDTNPADPNAAKTFESQLAEVAWFLRPTEAPSGVQTYSLFRRQLLVAGYVGAPPFSKAIYPNAVVFDLATGYPQNPDGNHPNNNFSTFSSWGGFYDCFDLSVKIGDSGYPPILMMPNTLADLTRRENRFLHYLPGRDDVSAGAFRFPMDMVGGIPRWQTATPSDPLKGLFFDRTYSSTRVGEDVILTNVLAFDVRVFDPSAPVRVIAADDIALVPGDPGFAAVPNVVANGAYVDLGWARDSGAADPPVANIGPHTPRFADLGDRRSGLRPTNRNAGPCVYDTWSTHYESNGFNDDAATGDTVTDQGSDGLDNDSDGKVDESPFDADGDGTTTNLGAGDDPGELETAPPYPAALRGIEIRLRCYEPSSRQVRQVTIRHSFVPR